MTIEILYLSIDQPLKDVSFNFLVARSGDLEIILDTAYYDNISILCNLSRTVSYEIIYHISEKK